MFIQESLKSLFTSTALQVFPLNNDFAADQTRLSINFYEYKFLGWWLDLQLYHSYNTHSQVVMRFTLSPEHHSDDGGTRHSRGILSSLKMTPSPFNSAACRYRSTNYLPIEWELSLKILIKLPGSSQWVLLAQSPYIPILILKWVHSICLPITFGIERKIQLSLKLQKVARLLACKSQNTWAWDSLCEYTYLHIFV